MTYGGEDRRQEAKRWKIIKEVSLGDVLAVVMAGISVVYAYSTLDKRLTVVEDRVDVQAARDDRQDSESRRYQEQITVSLQNMNDKLDRIIERGLK